MLLIDGEYDARVFARGIALAARAGHDTDAAATLASSLLDVRSGESAVPARWLLILHGEPAYDADDLIDRDVDLAHVRGCARTKMPGPGR